MASDVHGPRDVMGRLAHPDVKSGDQKRKADFERSGGSPNLLKYLHGLDKLERQARQAKNFIREIQVSQKQSDSRHMEDGNSSLSRELLASSGRTSIPPAFYNDVQGSRISRVRTRKRVAEVKELKVPAKTQKGTNPDTDSRYVLGSSTGSLVSGHLRKPDGVVGRKARSARGAFRNRPYRSRESVLCEKEGSDNGLRVHSTFQNIDEQMFYSTIAKRKYACGSTFETSSSFDRSGHVASLTRADGDRRSHGDHPPKKSQGVSQERRSDSSAHEDVSKTVSHCSDLKTTRRSRVVEKSYQFKSKLPPVKRVRSLVSHEPDCGTETQKPVTCPRIFVNDASDVESTEGETAQPGLETVDGGNQRSCETDLESILQLNAKFSFGYVLAKGPNQSTRR
uniref:Uncharacterized protein n=1 Tax=Rhodosorus marinus TaxID=101924 RepID=A0A7S2ZJQ5_9RHOD|mmetsp:Transcript_21365/g.87264  ORF Transcript_21365/g.87264 Transcript_21365/m.87264 type:complete len:395 (+) Transcript_21365:983-2167(+)